MGFLPPIHLLALASGFDEKLHLPIDGGIMIADDLHFVMDYTLLVIDKHKVPKNLCKAGL